VRRLAIAFQAAHNGMRPRNAYSFLSRNAMPLGIRPINDFAFWLINGILWPDATRVHHDFRLVDADAGRVLAGTVEIHTLELGRYNVRESELSSASMLDCWLYWLPV
jgi:hypothetical protein